MSAMEQAGHCPAGLTLFTLEAIELDMEIGISPGELNHPQRVLVTVEVGVENHLAPIEDTPEGLQQGGYDYSRIYETVQSCAGRETKLIETLANRIADQLFDDQRVMTCTVTVVKLRIWRNVPRLSTQVRRSRWANTSSRLS